MMRTRIKICGLTRPEDAQAALQAGADALGFVFYPPSPRAVSIEQAGQLLRLVPPFVTKVGLFVNETPRVVETVINALPLDVLQFHGDESPEYCAAFHRPWIKAARVRSGFDLLEFCDRYADAEGVQGILADAYVESFGGAGATFDWSLIPAKLPLPLVLSGGLTQANVEQAVRTIRPWAVDVSSGVEVTGGPKGIKCPKKIHDFIAGVQHADAAKE